MGQEEWKSTPGLQVPKYFPCVKMTYMELTSLIGRFHISARKKVMFQSNNGK